MNFYCNICDLNLHVKCALFPTIDSEDAKEIKHFCHPHTLALVENDEEYGSEPRCVACAEICLPPTPTFRCSRSCNHFFLHQSRVVKLPYKSYTIKHPSHPTHPLTITSRPYNDHIRTCGVCFRSIDSTLLAYSCRGYECKFNLHLDCYNVLPSITFSGHEHLLNLLEKSPNVTCYLCGVNCRNFVLRCVSCDINIHLQCLPSALQCLPSAPKTIKHKSHLHPLTLTKSPFEYELNLDEEDDEFYCDVCEQKRNQRELIYYCAECKFIAEVKCVISEVLSLTFEVNLFEKEISKNHVIEAYPKIQKWQLENLLLKRIRLHEGQLLINHDIHPCTLIFITNAYGNDECDCCGKRIDFRMFSSRACNFDLHVKCAIFPTIDSKDAKEIKHFYHPRILALVENDEEYGSEPRCVACAEICLPPTPTFRCSRSCKHFFLHQSCVVKLPYKSYKIKHPSHPSHPLTITSRPYNDHIRTCDVCFRGIDSTLLAYSCLEYECKFNLHLDCYKVLPSITFSGHEHLLTLLEKTPNVTCRLCGVNCRNFILRCVPCDINIHLQCLPSAPKTIKHKSHLHHLTITKSPFEYELNSDEEDDEFYCEVCEQKRNKRELIYYCAECKFIAEVKCRNFRG
ncbi:hypothetical protein PVK06_046280 [Gossypium arboreum]|uniref:Phorbol-ester/DAG-type domain-containing protein n=1 Tax=Gossypium arboreum TaxID=29729 RepID=A0ABR0MAJ7_GOSAR|nr:hypothetical protein PVK06_046280 [Gossypium arboreum]